MLNDLLHFAMRNEAEVTNGQSRNPQITSIIFQDPLNDTFTGKLCFAKVERSRTKVNDLDILFGNRETVWILSR